VFDNYRFNSNNHTHMFLFVTQSAFCFLLHECGFFGVQYEFI